MKSKQLEDYALLSDCHRAALVHRDGTIDWMCLPRFDSGACFAALLGHQDNGCWILRPSNTYKSQHQYKEDSLVLETLFETDTGKVLIEDALIVNSQTPLLIRSVTCLEGEVEMTTEIRLRMDYGSIVPWVRKTTYGIKAVAGPDEVHIQSPVTLTDQRDLKSRAEFKVKTGQHYDFVLSWCPSHYCHFELIENPHDLIRQTNQYWKDYASINHYKGKYKKIVNRSILTLKALTYEPTGGIVASPTTSLPEQIGGVRNWDYRYCWIRDSTFCLYALLTAGYQEEAGKWNDWLLRAVAGTPAQTHIMYGLAGERRLPEVNLSWLDGYKSSRPVRQGNAAYKQHQLDVFGEVLDTFHLALKSGLKMDENCWRLQNCFIEFIESHWDKPDDGIWEVRQGRRHFTHSKVMAWVAVDRAIRNARLANIKAPFDRWEKLKHTIHESVCHYGYNKIKQSFTQSYESETLDASLLMIPIVGFLPPEDPRVISTIKNIENELMSDGFIMRYKNQETHDGLTGQDGVFIPCSFWLVDNLILMGLYQEAEKLFERILSIGSNLGLFSEEYDVSNKQLIGNFPQALSHISLINTAFNLSSATSPARDRSIKNTFS